MELASISFHLRFILNHILRNSITISYKFGNFMLYLKRQFMESFMWNTHFIAINWCYRFFVLGLIQSRIYQVKRLFGRSSDSNWWTSGYCIQRAIMMRFTRIFSFAVAVNFYIWINVTSTSLEKVTVRKKLGLQVVSSKCPLSEEMKQLADIRLKYTFCCTSPLTDIELLQPTPENRTNLLVN